jgi:ABC-type multidrug transport system permease subunit
MGEKEDAGEISPPQSILIHASNPNAENDTRASATFPGAQRKHNKSGFKKAYQVIDKSKKKKKVIDKSKKKKKVIDKRKNLKQGIISVDGKPSKELLGSSLLLIIISTVGFFFIDSGFIADDFMCCLVCNGNSIGLVLLGAYSAQYGKWERTVGAKSSAVVSVTGAVLMYIVAAILFALWLLFATS